MPAMTNEATRTNGRRRQTCNARSRGRQSRRRRKGLYGDLMRVNGAADCARRVGRHRWSMTRRRT